ncbi:ABC transporter permease [Nocardioides limicola]|uniref:ABC transporter permease n=1 Tax=Nocardioides limicola TaxID=2803368 RepID=UPI00193BA21C|nr:ABC transporter permease [Nocardioides sp. DJM-14]
MTGIRRTGEVLLKRSGQALGVALAVSILCFVVVQRLPGDVSYRIAAGRYGYDLVDNAAAAAVAAELGLDRPAWQQFGSWLAALAQGDLGRSLVTSRPVGEELAFYLLGTLQLTGAALLVAILIGGSVGVLAARHPGSLVDHLATTWVASVRALPPFLLGLLLVLVFSVQLGWLPAVGHGNSTSLVLPAMTLGLGLSGLVARVTRETVINVWSSSYVQFAHTRGIRERLVLLRHVLRNSAVVLVPYLGAQAILLIEGVIVVESLFAWQGLGHALVHAVFWRDIPMLQATALALALLVVSLNTVVDLIVLRLDPRPRRAGALA